MNVKIEIRLEFPNEEIQELETMAAAVEMTLTEWIADAIRLGKEASQDYIETQK